MSSTIFYKFLSQKTTSRIIFDGTGMTVFDLKREIINDNKLGDGTDFQLRLYLPDTQEELEDDAQVIPRSSSVSVRRSPSIKFKKNVSSGSGMASMTGNASRYVTGRPRVMQQQKSTHGNTTTNTNSNNINNENVSEEQRIANMFASQTSQWEHIQQEMAEAVPVYRPTQGHGGNGNNNETEGPPPPGYMCYRCGGRDHWIRNCPTNGDPNYEGKRLKRTTGIPRKFLKNIEVDPSTLTAEEMAQKGVMVTEDGQFVVQIADEVSWQDYQRKQKQRHVDSNEIIWEKGHFKDLTDDIKCPLTGGLLKNPVKTPCCNKYVSKKAMEDHLVESDFICPLCDKNDILLDSLIEDNKEIQDKIDKFIETHKDDINEEPANKKIKIDETANITNNNEIKQQQAPTVPMPVPPFGMFPMPFMPFMPMIPNAGSMNTNNTTPVVDNNNTKEQDAKK